MSNGVGIEVGIAGREGMSALSIAFGNHINMNVDTVQAAGNAFCIDALQFAEQLETDIHLRAQVQAYVQYSLAAAMQFAACIRCHLISERYARSLLMTADRVGSDTVKLTHECSAEMLGVRRAGISVAAATLSDAGVIKYGRGSITVLDRQRLERASCECYAVLNAALYRCMGYGARQSSMLTIAA
jgi:CRP-like cAMP-binding protein